MKKSGPLNDALHDITELDKQLRSESSGAVVRLSEARWLKKQRRDKVMQIETSERGRTGW
jgi:hypothetical protein